MHEETLLAEMTAQLEQENTELILMLLEERGITVTAEAVDDVLGEVMTRLMVQARRRCE